MTPRDERRLVRRLKAREERAFSEFVEAHQHLVFNLVYRMLGDREEAEEVSQEVFVTVFKTIGSFRGDSKLSTWLYRVSANHAKNRLKYLARRRVDKQEPIHELSERELYRAGRTPTPTPTSPGRPDQTAIGHELEDMIQKALETLDEDYRLVILLRDVENLSYEEIAEITGLAMGTVKSRLHRARVALRSALSRVERKGLSR